MKLRRKKTSCFNCDNFLGNEDNFCRNCGQENHDKTVSLKMLINDFLGDYFTFDSKIWRSLKLLLSSPGQLTLLYTEGKRVGYVPPIRLVLFSSVLYVLLLSFSLDNRDAEMSHSVLRYSDFGGFKKTYVKFIETGEDIDTYSKRTTNSYFDGLLIKGALNMVASNKNVANEIKKQMGNMFLLIIPFYGVILMLVFWKSKQFYVEHFVHSLHIQSFFFILFSLQILLCWLFNYDKVFLLVFSLIYFVYIYASYKKVYKRSVYTTIFKLVLTSSMFGFFLVIGFGLSFLLTTLIKYS